MPERLAPVFRDRDELATATNLGDNADARARAVRVPDRHLLAGGGASRWVNEEILAFKRLGREHRIFCLIVDGEPGASRRDPATADEECFPPALILQHRPRRRS